MPSPYKQRQSVMPQRQSPGLASMMAQMPARRPPVQQTPEDGTGDMMRLMMQMSQVQQEDERNKFYMNLAQAQERRAQAGMDRQARQDARQAERDKISDERYARETKYRRGQDVKANEMAQTNLALRQKGDVRSEESHAAQMSEFQQRTENIAKLRGSLEQAMGILGEHQEGMATGDQLRDAIQQGYMKMAQGDPSMLHQLSRTHGDLEAQRFTQGRESLLKVLEGMPAEERAKWQPALMGRMEELEKQHTGQFGEVATEVLNAIARPNELANAVLAESTKRSETKTRKLTAEAQARNLESSSPTGYRARGMTGADGMANWLLATSKNAEWHKIFQGKEGAKLRFIFQNMSGDAIADAVVGNHYEAANTLFGAPQGDWKPTPALQVDPLIQLLANPVLRGDDGTGRMNEKAVTLNGTRFRFVHTDPNGISNRLEQSLAQFGPATGADASEVKEGEKIDYATLSLKEDQEGRYSPIETMIYNQILGSGSSGRKLPAGTKHDTIILGRDHLQLLKEAWDSGVLEVTDASGKTRRYEHPWTNRAQWLRNEGLLAPEAGKGYAKTEGILSQNGAPDISRQEVINALRVFGSNVRDNPAVAKITRAVDEIEKSFSKDEIKWSEKESKAFKAGLFRNLLRNLLVDPQSMGQPGMEASGESNLLQRLNETGDINSAIDGWVEEFARPYIYSQYNMDPSRNQRRFRMREDLRSNSLGDAPSKVPGLDDRVYSQLDYSQFGKDLNKYSEDLMGDPTWLETKPVPAGNIPGSFFNARQDIQSKWNQWGTAVPRWWRPYMVESSARTDLAHAYSLVQQDLFRHPEGLNAKVLYNAMKVLGQPGPFSEGSYAEVAETRRETLTRLLEMDGNAAQDPLLQIISKFLNAEPDPARAMPMPAMGAEGGQMGGAPGMPPGSGPMGPGPKLPPLNPF